MTDREAFEKWCAENGRSTSLDSSREFYWYAETDAAWQGWQAATECAAQQARKTEPVAWRGLNWSQDSDATYLYRDADDIFVGIDGKNAGEPLYLHPPAQQGRKPMTRGDADALMLSVNTTFDGADGDDWGHDLIRAVEAFHGIKETP